MTDDRPRLLLLHDDDGSPDDWREFVPLLESRFAVETPELPAGDRDARLATLRSLVAEPVAMVGHGTGGSLAIALAAEGLAGALVLLGSPADRVDPDALAAFEFPVLLLWGEDDERVPVPVAESLNDAIATSTLGILPGCGHDLLAEAPATIAPMILEYLRARYLKAPHDHGSGLDGVVRIQLERRPPWVDLAEDEADPWFDVDDEEAAP
jgi:pimeloyl-ACP methyl ester carboxylesterase